MPNLNFKKPIDELEEILKSAGIPYERRELFDGYQICVPRFKKRKFMSVVCHSGSYGHEQGLLEFWDTDSIHDPLGDLSPSDAYAHILLFADYYLDKNPRIVGKESGK